MNAFDVARRRAYLEDASDTGATRWLILVASLGVVVFGGFFAIGRAVGDQAGASPEGFSPNIQIPSTGTAIPPHLSNAPQIQARALASPIIVRHVAARRLPVPAAVGTPALRSSQSPASTPAISPAPTPAAPPVAAAPPAPAPARSGEAGGKPKSQPAGSVSFDSSG